LRRRRRLEHRHLAPRQSQLAGFYRKAWEGQLIFANCLRYRLGGTNDEGWYRGQCRFSRLAPAWGEFYEVSGDLLEHLVDDWVEVVPSPSLPTRHYLFYLRDRTFECDAASYRLEAAGFV
jgi:hypothetical protein